MSELDIEIPIEENIKKKEESPLARPLQIGSNQVGNRWVIHPMEGWDATTEGTPTENLKRRWCRFGESGAKFLWGFEAIAVRHDGRANPNQLVFSQENAGEILKAVEDVLEVHQKSFGSTEDLLWGLQLTHSGRFSRPHSKDKIEPRMAYSHPILNRKFGFAEDYPVLTDDEVKQLIEDYVQAAYRASQAGVPFLDVKQCHGYLIHEFLSAFSRPGPYGGESLENRSRFAREIIEGIRQVAPQITLGVRLSAYDIVPFKPDEEGASGQAGVGVPEDYSDCLPYRYGFGVNQDHPVEGDLTETVAYLKQLVSWGISVVNVSCGSPYYNPHIQRPAAYPPSDGYYPGEDPLIYVAKQIDTVRRLKEAVPEMLTVSSGLTYLQEYLPQVAQALVAKGWTDLVGMGRMVLSYPRIVADSLEKGALERKKICRTFSDCTTAPRNGMVSGCFPLDPYYKESPEAEKVKQIKESYSRQFKNSQ